MSKYHVLRFTVFSLALLRFSFGFQLRPFMFIESVFSGSVLMRFSEPPQTSYAFGLKFSGRCGAEGIGNNESTSAFQISKGARNKHS